MFEGVLTFFKVAALKRSLKKRAPGRFPYSEENNYYVPSIRNLKIDDAILVDEIRDGVIIGRRWVGEKFSENVEISASELQYFETRVSRFYGYIRVDYETTKEFWLKELTLSTERKWVWEKLFQSYYNATLKFRDDRIEVLKKLVDIHLKEKQENEGILHTPQPKSIVSVFSDYFGNRIYGHPAYNEISARFRFLIESLADSGELNKIGLHEFQLTPKALVSLSQHEKEERRHADSVRQARRLFWITVAIALATCMQAYVAFISG